MNNLRMKIQNETALIGIIGLGYVGLPLAIAFSKVFTTIGYEINEKYINDLKNGKSHILDIPDNILQKYLFELMAFWRKYLPF